MPANITVDDTNTIETAKIVQSLETIYGYERVKSFLAPIVSNISISHKALVSGSAYYDKVSQTSLEFIQNLGSMNNPTLSMKLISIGDDATSYVSGISTDFAATYEMTLVHELVHALTIRTSFDLTENNPEGSRLASAQDSQYLEQIAIFGTNATIGVEQGLKERWGHLSPVSGDFATSQIRYITKDDKLDFEWVNGNARFINYENFYISGSSNTTSTRTYWRNISFDGEAIRNYITMERDATPGTSIFVYDKRTTDIISQSIFNSDISYVNSSRSNIISTVSQIGKVNAAFNNVSSIQSSSIFVANERFNDAITGNPWNGNGDFTHSIDHVGPVYGSNDMKMNTFFINASTYTKSLILVGGSKGSMNDILKSGSGNDAIIIGAGFGTKINEAWAGAGDDAIVGGLGSDKIMAEGGNDVIIPGGGGDKIDGGSELDLVSYAEMKSLINIDMSADVHSNGLSSNISGTTIRNVEYIRGTVYSDIFKGGGLGMNFMGSGGNDKYIASDGADNFIDENDSGFYATANNSLDFSLLTQRVILNYDGDKKGHTNLGHIFDGVSDIRGSELNDEFIMIPGNYLNVRIWGGGGDDKFHISSSALSVDGENGNDYFMIHSSRGDTVIRGGDELGTKDTLDFSEYSSEAELNLSNGSFRGMYGYTYFSGIEEFVFGSTTLRLRGSNGTDIVETSSGINDINTLGGVDYITVKAPDELTSQNIRTLNSVVINAGDGDDILRSFRASTLNGDSGNDHIWGSEFTDKIDGGLGNDWIYAFNGDEIFNHNNVKGYDHIDAGDGSDTFASDMRMSAYEFFIPNEEGWEIGIKLTGSSNENVSLYKSLEKASFFASWSYNEKVDISKAIAALANDNDHYMTGDELRAGISSLNENIKPLAISSDYSADHEIPSYYQSVQYGYEEPVFYNQGFDIF